MTEALLFSVLEISLLPRARTDGQVATYLTDRRKVSGLGDLEAPVLGWTQTRAGAEPSLPAGLIRDQMISQGQESTVWCLGRKQHLGFRPCCQDRISYSLWSHPLSYFHSGSSL